MVEDPRQVLVGDTERFGGAVLQITEQPHTSERVAESTFNDSRRIHRSARELRGQVPSVRETPPQGKCIVESRRSRVCPEMADVGGGVNVDDYLVEHGVVLEHRRNAKCYWRGSALKEQDLSRRAS